MQQEFGKMGIDIIINDDEMKITGGTDILKAIVQSHNDHRIAMACSIAALGAKEKVEIENAECVEKSYPDFYKDLASLGASIQIN